MSENFNFPTGYVNFPVLPTHPEFIEIALEVSHALIEQNNVKFVSGPINTGIRFYTWLKHFDGLNLLEKCPNYYNISFQDQVFVPNCNALTEVARKLKYYDIYSEIVNPMRLIGLKYAWTKEDYLYFWSCFVEKFAIETYFVDGWTYSSGSVNEFYISQKKKIECIGEDGYLISKKDGIEFIELTRNIIEEFGYSTFIHDHVLKALKNLC